MILNVGLKKTVRDFSFEAVKVRCFKDREPYF